MTRQQRETVRQSAEQLNSVRHWLDTVMYGSGSPVTDSEHTRLRAAYDHICQAIDSLA